MVVKNFIDKILKAITVFLVGAICLVVIWQVFTRFVLNNPSSWSEEISRYLLIWITFLGGSLGLSNGSHMGLVMVTDRIRSEKVKAFIHAVAYLVCAYIGYIFIRYGWVYMQSGMRRTMMCCKIPLGYVYAIMPFSGVVIILNSLELIIHDLREIFGKKEG